MSIAWFVDGAYIFKVWQSIATGSQFDYTKLRKRIERDGGGPIDDAYYFNADPEPPTAAKNAFHNHLQYPPPEGPGLRVKLYWLSKRPLAWPHQLGGGPVLHPDSGEQFVLTTQKGVDVGLAFHMIRSFHKRAWKRLFLAAGDGDFGEVVQHLVEDENVELTLVGSLSTISEELRPYARSYIDLVADRSQFMR